VRRKAVIPRELAIRDVEAAIDHYRAEAPTDVTLSFVEALEQGYAHIGRYPASGSGRFSHELNIPGLRSWPLEQFPYVLFYIEREDHIDVWRVLHGQRDIPTWMVEP
jgi:toxin ParE1/3/4